MSGSQESTAGMPGMPMMRNGMMSGDMADLHYLLDHRQEIQRTVTRLPGGVDTLTESDNPEVAAKIKVHVAAMSARLKDGRPIHLRDPLFRAIFQHADQIDVEITPTERGLRVVETSPEPDVALLIQQHAEAVNLFIANGMSEMMKDHPVP